jgi:ABC-type glycerol-3-phosphate transport system substrate-binding protein
MGTGSAAIAKSKSSTVNITVGVLVPGATKAANAALNHQIATFMKENPGINVKQIEYDWTAPTFAAQLAAGTLPTMFTVPFTNGRALGDAGQIANLTKYAKSYPWFTKFNKAVIAEGTDSKGQIVAIPEAAYAQALTYNRTLFSAAGLNPNKPPTTWAGVESDAVAIAKSNPNAAGFAMMGANDNTAGWILTTLTDAFGGSMESGPVANPTSANFDNPGAVAALDMVQKLREANAMGSNFGLSWGTSNQAFAAGQIGMFVSGSDVYTNMVQAYSLNPSIYGLAALPEQSSGTGADHPAILGGGTLVAVSPKASQAQIAASVKWINYYYMDGENGFTKSGLIAYDKSLLANNQPVGVPEFPIFNAKLFAQQQKWQKSLINVPESQFAPFNSQILKDQLVSEPAAATQAIYGDLDSVVEDVLTDPTGANIPALLSAANASGNASIQQAAAGSS